MNSHALSITSDRIDLYLLDAREYGSLVPEDFRLDLWLDQGFAHFNLNPHCEFVPLYFGDCEPNCSCDLSWQEPHKMNGAVTLVDRFRAVLDQVEFSLDARITRMLGVIFDWQSEMGWTRDEIEMRTWWASRAKPGTGKISLEIGNLRAVQTDQMVQAN